MNFRILPNATGFTELELRRIIKEAEKNRNVELSLAGQQLKRLPKEIGRLKNLKVLDLSQNWIEILPVELMQLHNLTDLGFFSNSLEMIPKEIGKLTRLEYIVLTDNNLSEIPISTRNQRDGGAHAHRPR